MSRVDLCAAMPINFLDNGRRTFCIFLYSFMKQVLENILLSSHKKNCIINNLMTREHFVLNDYLVDYIMNGSKFLILKNS